MVFFCKNILSTKILRFSVNMHYSCSLYFFVAFYLSMDILVPTGDLQHAEQPSKFYK